MPASRFPLPVSQSQEQGRGISGTVFRTEGYQSLDPGRGRIRGAEGHGSSPCILLGDSKIARFNAAGSDGAGPSARLPVCLMIAVFLWLAGQRGAVSGSP